MTLAQLTLTQLTLTGTTLARRNNTLTLPATVAGAASPAAPTPALALCGGMRGGETFAHMEQGAQPAAPRGNGGKRAGE